MNSEELERKQNATPWILIICAVLFVLGLWLASWYYTSCILQTEDRSTFGDMFGAINALFAGLALAGIIISIRMQSSELALQRDELKQTRSEFKQQNITLEQQRKDHEQAVAMQNENSNLARLESTLFKMIELHHSIVQNLSLSTISQGFVLNESHGREVFPQLKNKLKSDFTNDFKCDTIDVLLDKLASDYTRFYQKEANEMLDHYFRNLLQLYKFIYLSNLESKRKQFYSKIVTSQLSSSELFIILYDSMVGQGRMEFLFLVVEYNILKSFNFENMDSLPGHYELYQREFNNVKNPFK